jgi:hypothetical protein
MRDRSALFLAVALALASSLPQVVDCPGSSTLPGQKILFDESCRLLVEGYSAPASSFGKCSSVSARTCRS